MTALFLWGVKKFFDQFFMTNGLENLPILITTTIAINLKTQPYLMRCTLNWVLFEHIEQISLKIIFFNTVTKNSTWRSRFLANCVKKSYPNLKIGQSKSRCKVFSLLSLVKKHYKLDFPVQISIRKIAISWQFRQFQKTRAKIQMWHSNHEQEPGQYIGKISGNHDYQKFFLYGSQGAMELILTTYTQSVQKPLMIYNAIMVTWAALG